ncbi:MAG: hypothetical protein JWO70_2455 [Betaproteobacteria bacterium]|nr:hypothetical protein [Betaproteobacteria bacterium]
MAGTAWLAHAKEISLDIDDIKAPAFSARSVRASLSGPGLRELTLRIDRLTVAGRDWRKVSLTCADLQTSGPRMSCTRGVLDVGEKIPLSFSYTTGSGDLALELKPAADETWQVTGRVAGAQTAIAARLVNVRLERFTALLPSSAPKLTTGRATGTIDLRGSVVKARVQLDGIGFADSSGLHAGEKIAGTVELDAESKADAWRWRARVGWRAGEVFWQPVFLSGAGQQLDLEGVTSRGVTEVSGGTLVFPRIGTIDLKGVWDHASGAVRYAEARTSAVGIASAYDQILKPLLQQTVLSDLRGDGELGFAVVADGDGLLSAEVELRGVSFEDRERRRFALFGASGRIPWRRGEVTTGELTLKGAEFLKVPLGATRIPLRLRGTGVGISAMRVPVFDGAVQLRDFAAGATDDGWRWRFSGQVEPISMTQLTQALGMPTMYGSVSGVIPELRYRGQILAMDGALVIKLFDGTVTAANVQLAEPFGRAPRLQADLEMKGLDLELLTRAFDFGTITGRIDARVSGLELSDWQPVRFDAQLASSAGTYPRKISQRAVQNISALGGAGAAAAIQRSFLRFFEQFGYDRIGLSCRLRNGVCEMDGVEKAPQGYVIVKGGGIPAISVIGYNRSVSWGELVDRLKRITQENVKPIVK